MIIRPLQPADLDPVLELAHLCFGDSAWSRDSFATAVHQPPTPFAGILPRRWALMAVPALEAPAGEPCLGYVGVETVLDEAELQGLAVHPLWRRRGVGSALLRAALRRAADGGAAQIFLEVRASNLAAQQLYFRHGFSEYGRRPHYYRNPDETAVLLRRLGLHHLPSL